MVRPWIPALLYMALIFVLSSFELRTTDLPDVPMRDKWIHLVEYFVLGLLCTHAAIRTWPSHARWRTAAVGILIASAWGLSDELHQAFVPGRSSEMLDLAADVLGATLGAATRTLAHRTA